jgi:metal-sulfur cluster biosynthetic enzyme
VTETVITELNPAVAASEVLEALGSVYDPELGVDVVNLGMVYAVSIAGSAVSVEMTLTTPGCPLHATIETHVTQTLLGLRGVQAVDVQIVWDPPWTPSSMSPVAKRALGF